MEPLRILIADDHPVFRAGLRAVLALIPRAEIVGEAATGPQAVDAALTAQPDIVVMNMYIPKMSSVEVTRRIIDACPQTRVLMLMTSQDDDMIFAAMGAGARGFLLRGAEQREILCAIETVASGPAIFCPTLAERIITFFSTSSTVTSPRPFSALTDREYEIFDLIARGESNTVIAKRLVLSPKTIRNHISNIFTKLQITDRSQAIVLARRAGLGLDGEQ
jgi:DNA-binding NarL/FixJ family response regulator